MSLMIVTYQWYVCREDRLRGQVVQPAGSPCHLRAPNSASIKVALNVRITTGGDCDKDKRRVALDVTFDKATDEFNRVHCLVLNQP
jgi:hypothetical protein